MRSFTKQENSVYPILVKLVSYNLLHIFKQTCFSDSVVFRAGLTYLGRVLVGPPHFFTVKSYDLFSRRYFNTL